MSACVRSPDFRYSSDRRSQRVAFRLVYTTPSTRKKLNKKGKNEYFGKNPKKCVALLMALFKF